MAQFKYGVDFSDEKTAILFVELLRDVEIVISDLDLDESRLMLESNQTMKEIVCEYAKNSKTNIQVEIWPSDMEYDEAESCEQLELYSFNFEKNVKSKNSLVRVKAYPTTKQDLDDFSSFLKNSNLKELQILEEWCMTEIENYGLEFIVMESDFKDSIKANKQFSGMFFEKLKVK